MTIEIEIIQYSNTKGIEEAMKTSRRKKVINSIPEKIFSWGHWSLLEHSIMTIRIKGISRACSHQLVRQRIGVTFTQESQRYFDPLDTDDWYVMPPKIQEDPIARKIFEEARKAEKEEYKYYRQKNIPKEDARFCLSNACKTTITWSFNMNSLIWFLEQRMAKEAQWEIRKLAEKIYHKILTEEPEWAKYLQYWQRGKRK